MDAVSKLAVLITCHNRREKTLACLKSLFQCSLPKNYILNVFLVDDGSNDGTAEAVKNNFPKIKIIQGNGNLFWNRGMHLAWSTAARDKDYDYYFWLNDDTYLFPNALNVLLSAANFKKNKSIIVATTSSVTKKVLTYGGFNLKGELIRPNNNLVQAVAFNGNCILIPKFVYHLTGNVDPLFHHAIGDLDYAYRAQKIGVSSFVAQGILANCEDHDNLPGWCQKEINFLNRIRSLYSPLGNSHPYYFFRFELRHFGLLVAIKHLLSIHLRVIMPQLWK